jgi:hypothetical protein
MIEIIALQKDGSKLAMPSSMQNAISEEKAFSKYLIYCYLFVLNFQSQNL